MLAQNRPRNRTISKSFLGVVAHCRIVGQLKAIGRCGSCMSLSCRSHALRILQRIFVVLLIWVYYSSPIALLGAEFTHVYITRQAFNGVDGRPALVRFLTKRTGTTAITAADGTRTTFVQFPSTMSPATYSPIEAQCPRAS
jgi:hypothetical protein